MKRYLPAALVPLLAAALAAAAAPPQAPPVQAPPLRATKASKSGGCPCAGGSVDCGCGGAGGGGCRCGAAGKSHVRASQERTGLGVRGGVRDTDDQASGPAPSNGRKPAPAAAPGPVTQDWDPRAVPPPAVAYAPAGFTAPLWYATAPAACGPFGCLPPAGGYGFGGFRGPVGDCGGGR